MTPNSDSNTDTNEMINLSNISKSQTITTPPIN